MKTRSIIYFTLNSENFAIILISRNKYFLGLVLRLIRESATPHWMHYTSINLHTRNHIKYKRINYIA